jgi:metal-sulfur cluster biosynthetic enzyme
MVTEHEVMKALEQVIDPELGVDIVNLGLIYAVEIDEQQQSVVVTMTLTTPGCPLSQSMPAAVWRVLLMLDGVSQAEANLTWHPAWDPSLMSPVGRAKLGYR